MLVIPEMAKWGAEIGEPLGLAGHLVKSQAGGRPSLKQEVKSA